MKPVIIYRLGSMGDTIVALPCLHKIAESFSGYKKIALTNYPVEKVAIPMGLILENTGLIDDFIEYPLKLRSPLKFIELIKSIRNTGADTLIYLTAGRGRWSVYRDILFFYLCGIKKIIGAPTTSEIYNCRINFNGEMEPEAERMVRSIKSLGAVDLNSASSWDLLITQDEKNEVSNLLTEINNIGFFVVNMGGKDLSKDWGEVRWGELIRSLANTQGSVGLIIVGASEDFERAQRILRFWPNTKINYCGRISPRICAGIMSKALFFIGHDSGPMHLAAATQVPCVGLFGRLNKPRKWYPYGSKHIVIHNLDGIENISVTQVEEAVNSLEMQV